MLRPLALIAALLFMVASQGPLAAAPRADRQEIRQQKTIKHLDEVGSLGERGSKVYTLAVPAGENVLVRSFAASDVDLLSIR